MQAGSNVYAPLPPLTAFCPPRGVEYWKKDGVWDIPVLRKPHLTRSRRCEETDAAAKALKSRSDGQT